MLSVTPGASEGTLSHGVLSFLLIQQNISLKPYSQNLSVPLKSEGFLFFFFPLNCNTDGKEKCIKWKITKNALNTTPPLEGKHNHLFSVLAAFFQKFLHIYEHFKHTPTHKWYPALHTVLPVYLGCVSTSANID